ncbi:MAG: hypothetical protein NVV63_08860 [Opitutus sp.]|nr:hypothetical protein [Opitutus sp.]
MSDLVTGAGDPAQSSRSASPLVGAAGSRAPSKHQLVPGQRWRDFLVGDALDASGMVFRAENASSMDEVILRASPITDATEWRRGAWERLVAMTDKPIVQCLDAVEENGWRYESSAMPDAMTLRGWMSSHLGGGDDVEEVVRQLAPILAAMHREGVVHLNLRPDTIYVRESERGLEFLLGGFEAATLYTQPRLAPAEVDPFYAPPEAAGLTHHQPGSRLCAWDWWSLGRIIQEYVLGQHILGVLLVRDVTRRTPELREKAEQLLLERMPQGYKAGAVEEMPDVPPATMTLLRGLLSSSAEARWGWDAAQRWLNHESVREHYDLPRTARLWSWKGRAFTLQEAVEFFTTEEHWEEGEYNLFTAEDPTTLAHFLQETPRHRDEWERLKAALDLAELPVWENVQPAAQRPAIAAAGWLALAGMSGAATQLRVRGRVVDVVGIMEWLGDPTAMDAAAIVNGLLAAPFVKFIEPLDAAAGRVLTTLSETGRHAVHVCIEHGWLDPQDGDRHARLLMLTLHPAKQLAEIAARLRSSYATCRHPVLARMLASEKLEPWEQVVLAYTGESAHRHQFVTHAEWTRERLEELAGIARQLSRVLFWRKLRGVLRIIAPGGRPYIAFAVAVAAGGLLIGGFSGSLLAGGASLVVLAGLAFGALWWLRRTLARLDPEARPWNWRDTAGRCATELVRFREFENVSTAELVGRLEAARAEFRRLSETNTLPSELADPPWWQLGAIIAAAAILCSTAVWFTTRGDDEQWLEDIAANSRTLPDMPPAPAEFTPEQLVASGLYEVVDDGFGRGLRGPLKSWKLHAPGEVAPLPVKAHAPASADQAAFALVSATLTLQPYARSAVHVLLAVRVPTTRGFGVMIFNTRDRVLVSREVILTEEPLEHETWYQLGRRRVLFLEPPLPIGEEISLAPP